MDVRFCEGRNHRREAQARAAGCFVSRFSTGLWEFGGAKNLRYPGSFVSRWQALHPVALGFAPHQARQFPPCVLGQT